MYFNPDATDLISQARLTDHEDLDVLDDATVRALAESIQAGTKAKTALRRPGLPSPTRSALSAQVISGNAAKERLFSPISVSSFGDGTSDFATGSTSLTYKKASSGDTSCQSSIPIREPSARTRRGGSDRQ